MKESLSKLWHGFFFGIGFAIAWWIVVAILGYAVLDRVMPGMMGGNKEVQMQGDDASKMKKQLNSGKDLNKMDMPSFESPSTKSDETNETLGK